MENIDNLKQMLECTYKNYKTNIAYQIEDKEIFYEEFIDNINSLGTKLISLGLKNEKVGIIAENRYEWEVAYFSIICGTGVVVPIDKSLPKSEIERIIKRAGIKAVFCSEKYIDAYKNVEYIISMDLEKTEKNILSQKELIKQGKELINKGNMEFINANIDNEELATIIFTSGTTDDSKAVMLSQKNLCSNLMGVQKTFNISEKDVVLSVLPLSHVLEGIFSLLLSISRGAKRIHCNNIGEVVNYMKKYKITFMGNVPAVYELIYDNIENSIAENINFLFSGGAYLNPQIVEKYKSKKIKLLQGYGITENSSAISLENSNNYKAGSCGKVISGVQIKLLNQNEEGIGELAIKGNSVMLGYYNDEEKTKKVFQDGWLLTGDLAKIDKEGYIFICGRSSELIVLENGKKFFPEEIEEKINSIDVVKESMVFENNNKICAKIVCNNELKTDIILEYIQKINEELPEYKRVRRIYVTERDIERTNSGKLKRKEERIKILKGENESKVIENEKESIEDKIKQIIANQLDVDISEVKNDYYITKDLMADSLDKVAIILKIEKGVNIKIPKDKYNSLLKVEDFVRCAKSI